ncbi:MAG TPA: GNAT family protein [Phycisphaerales bacterium]|nr:GNAT family protein [Phycisphaerales bacterium]
MHSDWVAPITLANDVVALEPLAPSHAAELARAAATPETFRLFSRGPREISETGMREFIEFLLGPAETVPFCVVERASGRRAGITTFLDIRAQHRGLEIGWTWYAPDCRGTGANPACKLLLMEHAFERLGAIRVCLKTDERNARSRAAILKLGAQFEGILRENIIMRDGFRRSTAMYSVLEKEWPGVKARLQARLGASGDRSQTGPGRGA